MTLEHFRIVKQRQHILKDAVAGVALAVMAGAMVCHDTRDCDNSEHCGGRDDDSEHDDIPDEHAVELADVVVRHGDEEAGVDVVAAVLTWSAPIKKIYKNKLPFSCVGVFVIILIIFTGSNHWRPTWGNKYT